MKRILITGAEGQLGHDFQCYHQNDYDIHPLSRGQCDILDLCEVRRIFQDVRPDVVLHAAAFTKVDKAEREPDQAFASNALGSRNVAIAAEETNAWLMAISTDYVFSGKNHHPYNEFDPPDPVNVYGRSKLAGEQSIASFCSRYTIVRTGWLYGSGTCFPRNVIRLAKEKVRKGEKLQVVDDQSGTPSSTRSLAGLVHHLVQNPIPGLVHGSCEGVASWFEFASEVITHLEIPCHIQSCATQDVPRPAPRPAYSVLDNMVLRLEGRDVMPFWKDELHRWLSENREKLLA